MKILIISLVSILIFGNNDKENRYTWKYHTITHDLLKIEEASFPINDSTTKACDEKYKLLDDIIYKCVTRVKKNIGNNHYNKENAAIITKTIDTVLSENRFVVCVKVHTLTEALTLSKKNTLGCVYCDFFKNYRIKHLESFDKVYHIDCDLGSFLYLGIFEILNLPVGFIEVPDHNFIRLTFDNNSYYNWDINTAESYSDERYRKGISGLNPSFDEEQEQKFQYLKPLTRKEMLGYYSFVVGRKMKKNKKYQIAKTYYEDAIKQRPNNPNAKHALAYMIIFTGAFNSQPDFLQANKLSQNAAKFYPNDKEYIETLACSYALLKDFKKAIEILSVFPEADNGLVDCFYKEETGIEYYQKKNDVWD